MSDLPTVVLALSPPAERRVEPLLFDSEAPLQLLATALDGDELLDAVRKHEPEAALLSPDLSNLTTAHCERVRATGCRVVGLAVERRDHQALDALGVDAKVDTSVSCEELLRALRAPGIAPAAPAATPAVRRERGERDGSLVAVLGGKGAPGSSECAASLSALAAGRWETLLVEADALGGGLALRLGADPNEGSILGLIRATQAGEGALRELLERWRCEREGWPAVLLGAPDPQALGEFSQPGAVTHALDALADVYPLVVCDVGFLLADPQVPATRAHREVLINADAVLVVVGSSEAQLRQGLCQLEVILGTLAIPPERLRIAVNGLGGPSGAEKDAINATIAEHLGASGATVDAWLAWDAQGARRAQRRGLPIAAARRRGPYAQALAGLLDELFLPDEAGASPKTKRRKRRLAIPRPLRRAQPQRQYEQEGQEEVALPWQT
jgi:MinD-like ATPase involved in chromosome partitioning or flagellar assembly